jgi:hypothetical protein
VGVINVLETFLCRYPEFSIALEQLDKPSPATAFRQKGVGTTANLNRGFQFMLSGDYEWMWIVDDGCMFPVDLLSNLLERNVDIIVPFSLNDDYPHLPEIYNQDCTVVDNAWLKEQEGLAETELLVTYRGMLVRRNVIETIQPPWCINAGLMPDRLGGDIYFCQQALEAGFKIYIDFENTMGRFAHFSVWPQKIEDDWLAAVHKDIPWET